MPRDQIKSLRRAPEEEIAKWLSSENGTRFVFRGLIHRGADNTTAYELTRTPSVSAGFISSLAALAIHWIAKGGIESAKTTIFSGDLNDIEYIILGALSRSLATTDHRAEQICNAVTAAFESRRSLPHNER